MKIDKEKLVELLVEKTSLEKYEVETQLEQLIERILSAAKQGKALEIKGFGTFYFDEISELRFDPAESLSTEISFKYAGMQPVELKPERDTSMPVADSETPDDEAMEEEEISPEDIYIPELSEEEKELYEKADFQEKIAKLYAGVESREDDTDEKEPVQEPAGQPEASKPGQAPLPGKKPVAKTPAPANQKHKKRSTPARKPVPFERRRSSGAIIWVVLAIVLAAAALWAYFYITGSEPSAGLPQQETAATASAGLQVMEHEPAETGNGFFDAENTPQEPGATVNNTNLAGQTAPVYGLAGEVNPQANDGYSIVLHSFDEEEAAREAGLSLEGSGFRTIVGSRTVAGRTMWRVSVGQFQTLAEAQDAALELPSPFNTQNFIHRIQLNN